MFGVVSLIFCWVLLGPVWRFWEHDLALLVRLPRFFFGMIKTICWGILGNFPWDWNKFCRTVSFVYIDFIFWGHVESFCFAFLFRSPWVPVVFASMNLPKPYQKTQKSAVPGASGAQVLVIPKPIPKQPWSDFLYRSKFCNSAKRWKHRKKHQ